MRHRILHRLKALNPYHGLPGVFFRELRRFRADRPQMILLFLIMPVTTVLFGVLYGNGTVSELPIAICDDDRSALSRTIIRALDATKAIRVAAFADSAGEMAAGIASGTYYAGFYFPAGMEADVKSGRRSQPILYDNGTNYLAASFIARDGQTVIRTVSAGLVLARLRKTGAAKSQAPALASPVIVDVSNLYNPAFNYQNYLATGVIFAQIGLMVMLSGAVCFGREPEHGSLGRLRFRSGGSLLSALHGKSLPYGLAIAGVVLSLLCVVFPLVNIGGVSETARAVPALTAYLLASWWMGAVIGMVTQQVLLASEVAIFIGMPAFIFSGWTFPLAGVPGFMAVLAQAIPFTHFMPCWFAAGRMNLGITDPPGEFIALCAMIVVFHAACAALVGFFWTRPARPPKNRRHRDTGRRQFFGAASHA
jgi:ABC-2 type transport system permease protein